MKGKTLEYCGARDDPNRKKSRRCKAVRKNSSRMKQWWKEMSAAEKHRRIAKMVAGRKK
jgi:hypothetical protein